MYISHRGPVTSTSSPSTQEILKLMLLQQPFLVQVLLNTLGISRSPSLQSPQESPRASSCVQHRRQVDTALACTPRNPRHPFKIPRVPTACDPSKDFRHTL